MLTIDIGNSRIKWGVWENDQIMHTDACAHGSVFDSQLFERCLPEMAAIEKIYVANVAGKNAEIALTQWLSEKGDARPVFLRTEKNCCGVTNAYSDPSQYGVDRWAALIAAKFLFDAGVCVIDIGTAVTIDFMNESGVHEGGMIMPGLNMMQKALLDNTADIAFDGSGFESIDLDRASDGLATSTEEAVKHGALRLLRAGLDDVCLQAVSRYGNDIKIILTGGLAEKILPLLSVANMMHEPHLVLKGLHIAAEY